MIVRHGPAGGPEEKALWKGKDRLRPLTAEGKAKTRQGAKGLARVAGKIEVVATSPLVRARQTADLVAKALRAPVEEIAWLQPAASAASVLDWVASRKERSLVLVGHEPQLGRLVAWLCRGDERAFTELKKGQACLIELERPEPGGGRLVWSLAPKQLRRLA